MYCYSIEVIYYVIFVVFIVGVDVFVCCVGKIRMYVKFLGWELYYVLYFVELINVVLKGKDKLIW